MTVYGLVCHQQNIILTEAKLRFIYYFVGDRPVHKLPFDPKCHELFDMLYSILANLSKDMFLLLYIQGQKRIRTKSGRKHYTAILTGSLTKTNRENINVEYNICYTTLLSRYEYLSDHNTTLFALMKSQIQTRTLFIATSQLFNIFATLSFAQICARKF